MASFNDWNRFRRSPPALPPLRPGARRGFLSLGLLGVVGMSVATSAFSRVPDAGTLEPVQAASVEEVMTDVLGAGQTFGGVLGRALVSSMDQQAILVAFREFASPSRLRVGTEFTLRYRRGDEALRAVEVAVNADRWVRVERGEAGWFGMEVETPVQVDTIQVFGEIRSDLWSAVVLHPVLDGMPRSDRARVIDFMDRVFQWQLDFSRQIQLGDTYRLALEREVRPDGSMRSGRILAAEIVNRGRPLHAIWFDLHEDGTGGYYDLEGESLRRAFLKAPLEFRRISSGFNMNRFHPILQTRRPHIGVDYAAPTGTPVMATSDGVVTVRGVQGGYGNLVEIRHSGGYKSRYAHLNGFASGYRVGDRVSQGQVIGYVGMTGLATGAAPPLRAAPERESRGPPECGHSGRRSDSRRRMGPLGAGVRASDPALAGP
jgi:murein DD-endopeptidase MepM/ murein hydrolase activator NlpD